MPTREILDFIYLDLPRLESVASQLIEGGIPESSTRSSGHESRFEGEISGGIPFVAKGTAGTQAVLSANSTVTSRYHHLLVVEVIRHLREYGFLRSSRDDANDGEFVHVTGELQVVDPRLLSRFMASAPSLQQAVAAFTNAADPEPRSKADKRAGRGVTSGAAGWPPRSQTDSMKQLLDLFAADSARIRVIVDSRTVAVGVVEREKFVEDLERLVGRHGQLFGGTWSVLGQANSAGTKPIYKTDSQNIYDLIESGGAELVETLSQVSGTGGSGLRITPLAIYRTVSAS